MSARPYHKRYHSDALAGFMSLTLEERGAYQTLLDYAYHVGDPVITERLAAGLCGVSIRYWRALAPRLVARMVILVAGDLVHVLGFDVELVGSDTRTPLQQWKRDYIWDLWGGACAYCGTDQGPMEVDHILAVARGGTDAVDNLTLACRGCNRSKGVKTVEEWLS